MDRGSRHPRQPVTIITVPSSSTSSTRPWAGHNHPCTSGTTVPKPSHTHTPSCPVSGGYFSCWCPPPPYCQVYGARTLYMMLIKQHGIAVGPERRTQKNKCRRGRGKRRRGRGADTMGPSLRVFTLQPGNREAGGGAAAAAGRRRRNGQGGALSWGAAFPNCLTRLTRALAIT